MSNVFSLNVPKGWKSVPMWTIATRRDRKGYPDAELLSVYREYGVIRKSDRNDNHNVESEDLSGYKLVKQGDLVLNKMKTWQGSLGVSPHDGIVSPAYFTCELSSSVYAPFIHYLLRSRPYIAMYGAASKGIRVGQWDLPYEEFRNLPVLLPPFERQQEIARYLDLELPKIEKLQELIKLQRSKIDEAFNSALNESVSLENPTNWMYFKFLATESNVRADGELDLPLLSVSKHKGIIPRSELMDDAGRAESLENYKICQVGDVVINRMSASSGALGLSAIRGVVSPDYAVLKPSRLVVPEYLEMIMKSPWFTSQMVMRLRGIGGIGGDASVRTPRVSIADLADVKINLPTIEEQKNLSIEFAATRDKTRALISRLDEVLGLTGQLRSSVIATVVTGAFDETIERSFA